jgi:hypothetical protein
MQLDLGKRATGNDRLTGMVFQVERNASAWSLGRAVRATLRL